MSIELGPLLQRHRLSLRRIAGRLQLRGGVGGQSLSVTALQRITKGAWPSHVTQNAARAAIAGVLVELGVPSNEVETAWTQVRETPASTDPNHPAADATKHCSEIQPETEMLSEDARRAFGIVRNPFAEPREQDDVYVGVDQRYVREAMYQTARHGGFLAVIGESGSGKSTQRRALLDRCATQQDSILFCMPAVVDKRQLTAQHICEALVRDTSAESPKRSLEALARQVREILLKRSQAGTQHCLLIEEAHDLHIETLKYLKRFFEFEDGFKKLLSIVLIGETGLGRKLSERYNPDAREVIRRCEIVTLRPLDVQLDAYLRHRLTRAGLSYDAIFAPDAADEIRARLTYSDAQNRATVSGVYPLSVQNLCIAALNLAAQIAQPRVDAAVIRRAAKW